MRGKEKGDGKNAFSCADFARVSIADEWHDRGMADRPNPGLYRPVSGGIVMEEGLIIGKSPLPQPAAEHEWVAIAGLRYCRDCYAIFGTAISRRECPRTTRVDLGIDKEPRSRTAVS